MTGWMLLSGDQAGLATGTSQRRMGGMPSGAWQTGVLMVALLFFVSCSSSPDCQHLVGHHRERGQQRDPHVPGLRETGAHRHVAAPLRER